MHNTLESSKVFPYIAWSIVVGLALFTYTLTLHLKVELEEIDNNVQNIEMKLNAMEKSQARN